MKINIDPRLLVAQMIKVFAYNAGDPGSIPGSGRFPWRRKWQPTPVLLPGKSHRWRSLVGYSPWGHKESDMSEQLHFTSDFLLLLSCFSRIWLCATHRQQPTRLPRPWDSQGKNTGVGCHFPLQCMKVKSKSEVAQSCPTLSDPMDCSPPGSPVPGILQARTLEWVAISFSNAWKWKVKVKSLSRVRLCVTPWTTAYQAPPSMGFSRQEYRSGVPLPSPSDFLTDAKRLWNNVFKVLRKIFKSMSEKKAFWNVERLKIYTIQRFLPKELQKHMFQLERKWTQMESVKCKNQYEQRKRGKYVAVSK